MGNIRLAVPAWCSMSAVLQREAEAKYPFRHSDGVDFKAWAKRILYREDRGDKDLLLIQVKYAKEAMGVEDKPAP